MCKILTGLEGGARVAQGGEGSFSVQRLGHAFQFRKAAMIGLAANHATVLCSSHCLVKGFLCTGSRCVGD